MYTSNLPYEPIQTKYEDYIPTRSSIISCTNDIYVVLTWLLQSVFVQVRVRLVTEFLLAKGHSAEEINLKMYTRVNLNDITDNKRLRRDYFKYTYFLLFGLIIIC